jgi:hypothetical protein
VKKLFIALCSVFIILCFPAVAMAHEGNLELEPLIEMGYFSMAIDPASASSIGVTLRFENGRGYLGGSVTGNTGTTEVRMDAVLRRLNPDGTTTYIRGWYGMRTSSGSMVWGTNHNVARGHYYRLTLYVTTVRHGISYTASHSRTARA